MYLLYVDASGVCRQPEDNLPYVLQGVCIHEGTWFALERRVAGLKHKFAFPHETFELHAKDFCSSITEQAEVDGFEDLSYEMRRANVSELRDKKLADLSGEKRRRRLKKYRETSSFVHLTRPERSQLFEESLNLVGSHDGIRLFAEATDKDHLFRQFGEKDCMRESFAQLISRFDAFLTRINREEVPQGRMENGLIVMDNDPAERNVRELMERYRGSGHPWGTVNHVIETPFFVSSDIATGIQLADICAYAVRRYLLVGERKDSPEEVNFKRIFHKFDRAGPKLHGIRHYCARQSCDCDICKERGHYV